MSRAFCSYTLLPTEADATTANSQGTGAHRSAALCCPGPARRRARGKSPQTVCSLRVDCAISLQTSNESPHFVRPPDIRRRPAAVV